MKRKRKFKPEELGRYGEKAFSLSCEGVGNLIVNKSHDHDAAGWDYIIDIPMSDPARGDGVEQSLDARTHQISCRVQVKSIWDDKDVISIKLSALARLASDPGPALIIVLKFASDLSVSSGYLIHLLDKNFERLLKRLRKEEKLGRSMQDLRSLEQTYRPSRDGIFTENIGSSVQSFLLNLAGDASNLSSYMQTKERQRRELGYGEHKFVASMTIKSGMADLVDGFLSLRPMEACDVNLSTVRFGISLPFHPKSSSDAMVKLVPSKPRICKLMARTEDGRVAAVMDVEVRHPSIPNLDAKHFKALAIGKLLTITIYSDRFSLASEDFEKVGALDLNEWCNYFQFASAVSSDRVALELKDDARGVLSLGRTNPETLCVGSGANEMRAMCGRARELSQICGEKLGLLGLKDLCDSAEDVSKLLSCVSNAGGSEVFIPVTCEANLFENEASVNYVHVFPIGSKTVAFSLVGLANMVLGTTRRDKTIVISQSKFMGARMLANLTEDYECFMRNLRSRTGVENVVEARSERLSSGAGYR